MGSHGEAAQAPVWADKGNRLAITFQERPASQDRLTQRCLPPARDIGVQASWSVDPLGSFNGSLTWREALQQTAYTAELERKTTHSAGCEEHVLARLQREHAMTHAELQASRRCIEETAVLKLEPDGSARADLTLSGGVRGRSLSCVVRTDFGQDTALSLDTHPEGGSSSLAASTGSGSEVILLTAKNGSKRSSNCSTSSRRSRITERRPPEETSTSRGIPRPDTAQRSAAQLPEGGKAAPLSTSAQRRHMLPPAGALDAELEAVSGNGQNGGGHADRKQEQDKRQAQAKNAQPEERWQPQNPLQLLGARCAFPLGAGAHGGWRLGLSQRISERLSIDAKLRGGSGKVNGGNGGIVIIEEGGDHSMQSTPSISSRAAKHRSPLRPSGGQIRLELRQPSGWRCSLMLNSNAQGPVLECKWRGVEAQGVQGGNSARPHRPAGPDAEQLAAERGRQWHSWHLDRLELPAWQRAMHSNLPSLEARAVMRGLRGKVSSLQASLCVPL